MSKINITNFKGVYEPAEDSWLMINHIPELKDPVLEIGCGTGIISIYLANRGNKVTALDLNPKAVEATKFNSKKNNTEIEVLEGDMYKPVLGRKFSTIVCNPPYLPPTDKYDDPDLALAVEGGTGGFQFTRTLLSKAKEYLNTDGSIFVIQSSKMDEFRAKWKKEVLAQKTIFFESLTLVRYY